MLSAGHVDLNFGADGVAPVTLASQQTYFSDLARQPDGDLVVAGSGAEYIYYHTWFSVARWTADGAPDTSFGVNGVATATFGSNASQQAKNVFVHTDAGGVKILAVGQTYNSLPGAPASPVQIALAQFTEQGSLDASFGPSGNGKATVGLPGENVHYYDSAVQTIGSVTRFIVLGWADTSKQIVLAAYTSGGLLDTTFASGGMVHLGVGSPALEPRNIAIAPDGEILLSVLGGFSLIRFNANGTRDTSFGSGGLATAGAGDGFNAIVDMAFTGTGAATKIVAVGSLGGRATAARFNCDGTLDTSFDFDGVVQPDVGADSSRFDSLVVQPDGKIIATGYAGQDWSNLLAVRLLDDGSLDSNAQTGFGASGIVSLPLGAASKTILLDDGKTVSLTGSSLVRLMADGPRARDDSYSTGRQVPISIPAAGVLANDALFEVPGTFHVSAVNTTGTLGRVTVGPAGDFTYDPNGAFDSLPLGDVATDTFIYTVTDNQGRTDAARVTVTISDPLSVLVEDVSVTEGTQGVGPVGMPAFTVRLSGPSSRYVTVDYTTTDGTAVAPDDYTAAHGTLTFDPGQTEKTIHVFIIGDESYEDAETFNLVLSNPTVATIARDAATCTIVDDDSPAVLTIDDVTVNEGDLGTTDAVFTVTLSAASGKTVTVNFATADGTASAPGQYEPVSGTLTFNPGQTERTIVVPVRGDTVDEEDETLFVTLSDATEATIGRESARGTIADDDGPPGLSVQDADVAEDVADAIVLVPVTLSAPSDKTVRVRCTTGDRTAFAGRDYTATSATLTFDPGVTTQWFSVPVLNDELFEGDETFDVSLSDLENATIERGAASVTIVDDEGPPTISISDAEVREGNLGTTRITFQVALSGMSEQTVSLSYRTEDNTATASSDYLPGSGIVTFAPHETVKTVAVSVKGDRRCENDEMFGITLFDPDGATLDDDQAVGTILNDDAGPTIAIAGIRKPEGAAGQSAFNFVATLSAVSGGDTTVQYSTSDVTAAAGSDYTAASGTLTIPAGQKTAAIAVLINGDTTYESHETFRVTLANPDGGTLAQGKATAVATIANDDRPPVVAIEDARIDEAPGGSQLVFNVTLSQASGLAVQVFYATLNGTAKVNLDYLAARGTLTFNPGETRQTIIVPVLADSIVEPDETLLVKLSGPRQATLGRATAKGTIEGQIPATSRTVAAIMRKPDLHNTGQSHALAVDKALGALMAGLDRQDQVRLG